LNDGTGNFPDRVPFGPENISSRSAAVGLLNDDTFLDVVLGDEQSGGVLVYLSKGATVFMEPLRYGNTRPAEFDPKTQRYDVAYALSVADLNRDGRLDILVGFAGTPNMVLFNEGRGQFLEQRLEGKVGTYGVAAGDLNGDGKMDIVTAGDGTRVYFQRATAMQP
jgi:hypothetical protein